MCVLEILYKAFHKCENGSQSKGFHRNQSFSIRQKLCYRQMFKMFCKLKENEQKNLNKRLNEA